jgi:hypothetical protein
VQPRLDQLRHRNPRPRRGLTSPAARPERTSIPIRRQASDDASLPNTGAPPADEASRPLRDRGVTLLAIFTGATLLIVALVCLVAGVDRWWILIPVMAVDLTVTGAVLAVMARLLNDGSST